MTVREEFEVWWAQDDFRNLDATYTVAFQAWNFAYRAGQEAMRERAAKVAEHYSHEPVACSDHIRALPLDAARKQDGSD